MAKRVLLERIGFEKRILSSGGLERKERLIRRARSVYKGTVFECTEGRCREADARKYSRNGTREQEESYRFLHDRPGPDFLAPVCE